MSDLTRFRDHCREMAKADHKPECEWWSPGKVKAQNAMRARFEEMFNEPKGSRGRVTHCEGCVTEADRTLFAQMAGEVDDYLAPQVDLFGEIAAEPTMEDAP